MIRCMWKRFANLPLVVQIIFAFCVWGTVSNMFAVGHDLAQNHILWRLHLGFLILYAGQVAFILLRERTVCILALLQGLIALSSNFDFTFVPFLRLIGRAVYNICGGFSMDGMEVYKYVFVSCCFTLDMLKTALLFILLPPAAGQPQAAMADASANQSTTGISQ